MLFSTTTVTQNVYIGRSTLPIYLLKLLLDDKHVRGVSLNKRGEIVPGKLGPGNIRQLPLHNVALCAPCVATALWLVTWSSRCGCLDH